MPFWFVGPRTIITLPSEPLLSTVAGNLGFTARINLRLFLFLILDIVIMIMGTILNMTMTLLVPVNLTMAVSVSIVRCQYYDYSHDGAQNDDYDYSYCDIYYACCCSYNCYTTMIMTPCLTMGIL